MAFYKGTIRKVKASTVRKSAPKRKSGRKRRK